MKSDNGWQARFGKIRAAKDKALCRSSNAPSRMTPHEGAQRRARDREMGRTTPFHEARIAIAAAFGRPPLFGRCQVVLMERTILGGTP